MKKFFILFFLLLNFNLCAEIIKSVELKGNKRISKETIKVYGEINLDKDYSEFDLNEVLKNLYKTDFFEDIKLNLSKGVLNIDVKEYPILNSITLEGEKSTSLTKQILKRLKLKEKQSFIKSKLSQDIDEIKKVYSSMGFNFIGVESQVERFTGGRINLVYILKKGQKTKISKINFIGDKKIKEKRLRDVIVSEEQKFWKVLSRNTSLSFQNVQLDKRLLTNYYKSLGYYDVQVLSDSAEVKENALTILTYTINAGNRYRVYKISTNVNEVLDKKIFLPLDKSFTKIIGKYYSPFTVKKLLAELDDLIAANDLQFIEHSVNEIIDNNSIEIKLNIFEGKKELVEKINIIGNTVTDESVIRGEFLLDEGDPFSNLKLDKTIAKIKSRNIFGEVKRKITEGSTPSQKIIEINVEEKPTGEISAGAGIGTAGGSFSFSITENNWLGKGINLTTSIDASKETLSGGISVTDPNYKFSGNSVNYFVSNSSNDQSNSGYENKIFTTGFGTSFEQYNNVYISPSVAFSYDDLKVDSTASESLKKQKGSFTDLSLSYAISLDNRDRAFAPTDGYLSSFSQTFPVHADSPYIKNQYNLSSYKTLSKNMVGSFKLFGSAINGLSNKDVRLSKRIRVPSTILRGFKSGMIGPKDGNDYIGGNYAFGSSFNMGLPNVLPEATKTDIGLFLDFGNVWKVDYDKQIDDSNKIRSTTGINASWSSPLGPMTFVISQNISKASTDETESFNFRLGTSF
jgi:outer membrane protein insertion porin family